MFYWIKSGNRSAALKIHLCVSLTVFSTNYTWIFLGGQQIPNYVVSCICHSWGCVGYGADLVLLSYKHPWAKPEEKLLAQCMSNGILGLIGDKGHGIHFALLWTPEFTYSSIQEFRERTGIASWMVKLLILLSLTLPRLVSRCIVDFPSSAFAAGIGGD